MKSRTIISIILAILLTAGAAYYQRKTGPTYTKDISFTFNEQNYDVKLERSRSGSDDCPIKIDRKELTLSANLIFRKYPTKDKYDTIPFNREGDVLIGNLPGQPPAGKLQYYFQVTNGTSSIDVGKENPTVIRFKGKVPFSILIPHIIMMFLAMFFSNLSGFLALFKNFRFRLISMVTLLIIFAGGMILGPIVQKYAFGEFWTGVPFGWDLTDNKTLVAFVFWLIAVLFNLKKERRIFVIIAFLMTLIIFSIPHSMFGSELNHETGKITTGFITSVFRLF